LRARGPLLVRTAHRARPAYGGGCQGAFSPWLRFIIRPRRGKSWGEEAFLGGDTKSFREDELKNAVCFLQLSQSSEDKTPIGADSWWADGA